MDYFYVLDSASVATQESVPSKAAGYTHQVERKSPDGKEALSMGFPRTESTRKPTEMLSLLIKVEEREDHCKCMPGENSVTTTGQSRQPWPSLSVLPCRLCVCIESETERGGGHVRPYVT